VRLFEKHPELGAFDAVLAATAVAHEASALLSADTDFRVVRGLRHVVPGTDAFEELLATTTGGAPPRGPEGPRPQPTDAEE
jgi:hypothetical protein